MNKSLWIDKNIGDLLGKTVLVTGSTSGVGLETVKCLLSQNSSIIMAARNKDKVEKIIKDLKKQFPTSDISYLLVDQSKKSSISDFFKKIQGRSIDSFVFNAGIYFPKKNSIAEDGSGLTFYTNVVGTFLLIDGLYKMYPKSRFIFVNSVANKAPFHNDYSTCLKKVRYSRSKEYAISKRAIMDLFYYYKTHYDGFFAMTHPGVCSTNIISGFAPTIKKIGQWFLYLVVHKSWKGCLGEVYLAASNDAKSGDYIAPNGLFHISGYPKNTKYPNYFKNNKENCEKLYKLLKENYLD